MDTVKEHSKWWGKGDAQYRLMPRQQDLLKLLALVSMVLDHANLALQLHSPALFLIGRLAFPLFGLLWGMNVAQGDKVIDIDENAILQHRRRTRKAVNSSAYHGVVSGKPPKFCGLFFVIFEGTVSPSSNHCVDRTT